MMPAGCDDYCVLDRVERGPSGEVIEARVQDAIERMVSFSARQADLQQREQELAAERDRLRTDQLVHVAWSFALATWTLCLLSGAVGFIVGLALGTWLIYRYWDRLMVTFGRRD